MINRKLNLLTSYILICKTTNVNDREFKQDLFTAEIPAVSHHSSPVAKLAMKHSKPDKLGIC